MIALLVPLKGPPRLVEVKTGGAQIEVRRDDCPDGCTSLHHRSARRFVRCSSDSLDALVYREVAEVIEGGGDQAQSPKLPSGDAPIAKSGSKHA